MVPGLTPQAPVLSPERVQLSSRDQNHVFGVRGHANSSPSPGVFTAELTHHAPPDPRQQIRASPPTQAFRRMAGPPPPLGPGVGDGEVMAPGKPSLALRRSSNLGACVPGDLNPMCPRGDLNTETGEISPDRGNHAIRVTRPGRTHPAIPRRVRYPVRYLACAWLDRAGRSRPPSVMSGATHTLK